jgi:small subunit ribosomal protein S20
LNISKGEIEVPNIKSAKKRTLVIEKKTVQNRIIKSQVKTEIKKFLAVVATGDKAAATELFPSVCSTIDGAVSKGVLKKNTAANKKSGLQKKLNAMA